MTQKDSQNRFQDQNAKVNLLKLASKHILLKYKKISIKILNQHSTADQCKANNADIPQLSSRNHTNNAVERILCGYNFFFLSSFNFPSS